LPFVKLKSAGNPHVFHDLKLEAIPAWNIEKRLDRNRWRALVNTAMDLSVPKMR
jgi:hypothetical protein